MKLYTEEQVKKAFEFGASWAVGLCDGEKNAESFLATLFDTPHSVHETNMSLFVWSELSWPETLSRVIKYADSAVEYFKKRDANGTGWRFGEVNTESKKSLKLSC